MEDVTNIKADLALSEAVADLRVFPIDGDLVVRGAFLILRCVDADGEQRLVFSNAGELPECELMAELIRQLDVFTRWIADQWEMD